ncbi:MAG: hypothetical protein HY033_00220 [Ignavibacteriae bacterium]|nr:hypothetical protein [Ignavibacteria bacterium]MBI3363312.1 hypothetical protein [Ignavibacteriota bacterium]
MTNFENLKQFVFNGFLVDNDLTKLEQVGIAVRSPQAIQPVIRVEETAFSPLIMHSATRMASLYVAFFCLENTVRELIAERLLERKGIDWWQNSVPQKIRKEVESLKAKEEKNKYHAQRSSALIGYTMFGNLAQIIISNWQDFSDLIPDQAWITSRFNDLEMSRNIIMHTGVLPEIEIERIESIVRDWIRQVG